MGSFARPESGAVFGGDFRIVRPLKEGGMGSVYVAEQLSTGARRALKLMHPQFAENEGMRRRFDQEARAAARIESDYVVAVIAAGVDEPSGAPWIAMELLEGEELSDHVARRGPLPRGEILDVVRMLCHAVGAAHDVGLVHRDLKPENIFLAKTRRSGDGWTLKVLDFGIARAASALKSSGTAALGTPLWMAPEQTVTGGEVGPYTDVWALGLIVYYLLTGTHYWRTAHDEQASITQFLRELAFEPLDPASERAAEQGYRDAIPAGFDIWFGRCVVREEGARFGDMRGALAALDSVLSAPSIHVAAGTPTRTLAPASPNAFDTASGAVSPASFDALRPGAPSGAVAAVRTIAISAPFAPPAFASQGTPARAFFVSPETERALMAAPPHGPPRVPPVVTGPGTSVTGDLAARPPGGRFRAGPLLGVALAIGLGAGGAWLWTTHHGQTRVASVPAPAPPPLPLPSPPASAAAGPGDLARAAQDVAKESPMLFFAGAVFPLGSAAGAIDERPVHDVSLATFALQIDEVTVGQFARCVAAGGCTPAGTEEFCNSGRAGRERNPVNCISQPQAAKYCAWLGRRLPTEDEWEYAASGRAKRLYAWGNTSPAGRACWGRPREGTCDVGSFDAGSTPEGLHDITGNVKEWTSSDYCPYELNLACARDHKVARGGGWFSGDPNVVRTQVRQSYAPETLSAQVGVRCAKAL